MVLGGAEGANRKAIATKLSGKRTVVHLILESFRLLAWTPKGKIPTLEGIISQVERQEEDGRERNVFLLFIFSTKE